MSKDNKDFFIEKKEWSKTKDSLLGSYLKPYFTKILNTGKPVIYVDSFAGAGKYGDSTNGSPLIALNVVSSVLEITRTQGASRLIELVFVEKNHYNTLCTNIKQYTEQYGGIHPKIIQGCHEEQLLKILEHCHPIKIRPTGRSECQTKIPDDKNGVLELPDYTS